jgi:VWFA-related protein
VEAGFAKNAIRPVVRSRPMLASRVAKMRSKTVLAAVLPGLLWAAQATYGASTFSDELATATKSLAEEGAQPPANSPDQDRDKQEDSYSVAIDIHAPNLGSFVQSEAVELPASQGKRSITLDVVVTDKSGRPVTGLQATDFTLLDNKEARSIVSLQAVDAASENPVEVFLLVDSINTRFDSVAYVRKELLKYLGQNSGRLALPTSLIFATDTRIKMHRQPTRDGNLLIADLNSTPSGNQVFASGVRGTEAPVVEISLRALDSLVTTAMSKNPSRKLIVWISPGWPASAQTTLRSTRKDQEGLFSYIAGISTALRDDRITLCSVDPYELGNAQTYYRSFLKGVTSVKQTDYAELMLQVLAEQSGGQVLYGGDDIVGFIDRCVADAKSYYTLSFNSAPATHPNEYHAIKVEIDKPGLKARTRTGYYAQP